MRIPAYLACLSGALILAACGGEAPPTEAATDTAMEGDAMASETAMPEATDTAMATESATPEATATASGE